MNMLHKIIIWIGLLGLAIVVPCLAQTDLVTVQTQGIGYILQQDTAAARDRAVEDAKIRAVESVCGTQVDAKTVIHKTLLVSSTVMTRTTGVVRQVKVLEESVDENMQLYRVKIEAIVDQQAWNNELLKRAGQKKILFLRQKNQTRDAALARELAALFDRAGFGVSQMFAEQSEFDLLGNTWAEQVLKEMKKDILVVFRSQNQAPVCQTANFCVSTADGFIQLYAPFNHMGSDSLLVNEQIQGAKGFGHTQTSAVEKALLKLNEQLVRKMVDRLDMSMQQQVKIVVKNIPDFKAYKLLKRTIESYRWVIDVKEDQVGYHPVKSVFLVNYKSRLDFLAGMLDKLGQYTFHGRDSDVFMLEFNNGKEH